MEIIHCSAELAPVAKVGGLGDVLFGLCRAQLEKGHDVKVFIPKYDCLDLSEVENLEICVPHFLSYFAERLHQNKIWRGVVNGFPVYFFESNDPYGFFERSVIYGSPDDPDRFLYFNRMALEYIHKRGHLPDILHVHDWHTALMPFLQKALYDNSSHLPKTVLTIHNLAYQGITSYSTLEKIGIPSPWLSIQDDSWNLIKKGISYADHITTVSPTYAEEILTILGGKGINQHLIDHKEKLSGILNGIDENFWNPQKDPAIDDHFGANDFNTQEAPYIKNKGRVQKHLRHMFFFEQRKTPLVGCITRLVHQKSPELIKAALLWTLDNGGQFVLLGSASDPKTHDEFYALKRAFANNRNIHIELSYNEKLSHLLYAAADMLLVPSLFEPCGLTQLIAMRYGTIPVVRKTGGLADTVFEGENGFLFGPHTKEAMEEALKRAFYTWYHEPEKWQHMMKKGMHTDFSWNKPAEKYIALYQKLLEPVQNLQIN